MDFRDKGRRKKDAEYKKRFGEKIKAFRIAKGLSQFKLGIEADLARTQISKIENGLASPTVLSLVHLAKALELTSEQIIELLDIE
ncbi:helix-turn-helix domain-containing protein [Croceitalea marina]|uniref:Helix-turn-helix domain-containing protein n=1 Tax=Croceitalea marina TaxID=1775166 RepID=A0ABW5N2J8_9FLAO